MKKDVRRMLRAQWRDARVLFLESRWSLLLFAAVIVGGALVTHFFYTLPDSGQHPSLRLSLYATFTMIFFQTVLPFPDEWYLEIMYFIVPILGLVAIADGVVRFWGALLNKKVRGQAWEVAMASTYSNHVIICGLGKVGFRVCQELMKCGRDVVGIEANGDQRFIEQTKELGMPVIVGDARRSEILAKASVQQADVIIPCTDNELTNLDIALHAREMKPSIKVVMRTFDADLARSIEKGFGIQTAISTSALAAPIFAAAAMRVNVKYAFYVGDILLNLSDVVLRPGSRLAGRTIAQMEDEFNVTIVRYQRGDYVDLHPRNEHELAAGDKILVLASLDTLRRLGDAGASA